MGGSERGPRGDSSSEWAPERGESSRPAPGKQRLSEEGAAADGGAARADRGRSSGGGGERAEAWVADDSLMSAMGLSDAPWCDAEEGAADPEQASALREDGGGGGGGDGGGDSEGEPAGGGAQAARNASTGVEPAASPDYERALSSVALPGGEGGSAAPAPLSPGATLDTSPPGGLLDGGGARDASANGTARVFGPPDLAQRPALGPPAPIEEAAEGSASASSKEDFLQPGWTLVNQAGIVYDEAGALLRAAPTGNSPATALPQNAKVHILKHNAAARWYAVVTGDGHIGYVADWLLWRHLPEESADVYRIQKGETPLGIARQRYGPHFTRWGQDLRFVVNALVYVNQKNRHNGTGKAGLAKPGTVSESWLRATAAQDVYIWLPSVDYLNSIYEEVRVRGGGTGSPSFDTFASAADAVGSFSVFPSYIGGLAHGFTASLRETVGSMFELVKNVFTGEIIEELKKLYASLSKLSLADVVAALGGWAQSWGPRLSSDNHFVRGHAWGYFAGYLCAEIAMCAIGGAALEAVKASRAATKLGQMLARTFPRLTAAVTRATAALGAGSASLREAKAAIFRRFGVVLAEEISKVRFRDLIAAAVAAGADPAAANRLARILHTAGIGAKKVGSWGEKAFANLAASPRTLAELEATLPLVKSGRVVGLEDWLKFGAGKTGDDAARVAAELREARRLAREHPGHVVNVGGDARAPKSEGDSMASFDLSVDDAAGNVVRSVEMTSLTEPVTEASDFSPALKHAASKVTRRNAKNNAVPGKIEAVLEATVPSTAQRGGGVLQIARNGDVVLVTRGVPPMHLPKGNLFEKFATHASKVPNNELVDMVTIVDRSTGDVLGRITRNGKVWKRVE